MKKIISLLFFALSLSSYGQITAEKYYPTGNVLRGFLKVVQFSNAGYKYVANDTSTITIYNLNHTVYLNINIPAYSPPRSSGYQGYPQILYISDELFNTNPNDIEYFIYYDASCRVYDQNGNTLFTKDSVLLGNSNQAVYIDYEHFISYTPTGVKMMIPNQFNSGATVYALPGNLPCQNCNNITTGSRNNANTNLNTSIINYPNPAKNETTVAYDLPQGVTTADLVFYNISGQEVKRFKVTNAFKDILVSTTDLEAGTYYYQIQTAGAVSAGKKLIVIK